MSEKIQVPADLQEICAVFEDSSSEHRYYLDIETGEIICISDDFMDPDETKELDEKVEEGYGEHYITIPNAESYDGYADMEEFIETVTEANLKEKLCIAINGRGAFRRFKDVLNSYQNEREKWFKFKDAKINERVNEWLDDEGIEIKAQKPIKIDYVVKPQVTK
jgi:hypothetical protein